MAIWTPQPGPQARAATCPADIILFGGSRGGGKSDCLIGRHVIGAERYGPDWNGLVLRRKYKDLRELRRRWRQLKISGLPIEIIGGEQQVTTVKFANGAEVGMHAVGRLEMIDDFQGHQYPEISVDEGPQFPFFTKMLDKLRGCNRSPQGVPCSILVTGNPGGAGHNQVKEFFKLGVEHHVTPGTVMRRGIELPDGRVVEESRVFIQSFLQDNRYLVRDLKYSASLAAIQDPALRKAWLEGDWDVFIGQAFTFGTEHIIDPIWPIPSHVQLYMTYDWGFGKPFAIGWWWADNDGRVIRFGEWYGYNGTPDEGLRLADSEVAEGVIEHEVKMGISGRPVVRFAGPDCFQKRPDFRGGGQGPSTAEVFATKGLHLTAGDPSRELKIRAFRERLRVPRDDQGNQIDRPMLQVYSDCRHFIRTVSALVMDEDHPEDIDTEQEDHIYDEACHICMARARGGRAFDPISLEDCAL